jgi:hypothetical protein
MRTMTIVLMLFANSFALAAPDADEAIQRIEAELETVTHERDALLQSFRMVQEMRTLVVSPPTVASGTVVLSAPMINYDDMVREAAVRRLRIERFDAELSRLHDDSVTLSDRDSALRAQLRELIALHRQ